MMAASSSAWPGNMRAIARELRGDSPGGNREAVSLNRVADTLDDRALIVGHGKCSTISCV